MNKIVLGGILGAIIIGISVLGMAFLMGEGNEENRSMPEKQTSSNENQTKSQGRNLTIEFDEKMGFSTP